VILARETVTAGRLGTAVGCASITAEEIVRLATLWIFREETKEK
jgi:hypothetical protein